MEIGYRIYTQKSYNSLEVLKTLLSTQKNLSKKQKILVSFH